MERVHWPFRIQVTVALILALIIAFNSPGSEMALAASNDNNVEWLGAGHLPGNNICGDANFPYRAPFAPRANQAVTLRARSYQGDLTGISIWYTTNSAATAKVHWIEVPAVWTNNWYDCGGLGNMDIWAGTIPAQTTQVWYKIAYTDGTDTDWHRGSGEGGTGMYASDDGGWTIASTSLTYSPPSTVYVDDDYTSSTAGWDYDHFATIQDGVNAVADGGTVNVAAGTYDEEDILINRGVTLQGAGATTTFVAPSAVTDLNTIKVQNPSGDVTIDGFTFVMQPKPNYGAAISVSGTTIGVDSATVTISNNIVDGSDDGSKSDYGFYGQGNNAKLVITNNVINATGDNSICMENQAGSTTVANNTITISADVDYNPYFSMTHDDVIVTTPQIVQGNTFYLDHSGTGWSEAVTFVTAALGNWYNDPEDVGGYQDVQIKDNVIYGGGERARGIGIFDNSHSEGQGTISGLVITGNNFVGENPTDSTTLGIYLYGDIEGAEIANNKIDSVLTGIKIVGGLKNSVYPSGTSINGNSITNTGTAVQWEGSSTLDASANWWGSNDSAVFLPFLPTPYDAIDYTPWLVSSTDTSTDPGFQGDFSTLWVDDDSQQTGAVGRIQEGINLVSGSTVNVAEGTYTENVVVNKAVTLTGAAGAIIDGGESGDVVSITANNVTLEGFTIQNSGANTTDGGVKLTSVTGCTVEGNTVTDNANGILVVLGSGNSITDNDVDVNDYYGIAVVAGTGNTINLNTVTGNGLDAIALDNASAVGGPITTGSTGNFILGNTITSNRDGVFLGENCDTNEVDGNTLSSITSIGVSAWRSEEHTITDNTISGAAAGIRLLGSSNNTITGNTLTGSTVGVKVDASWQSGIYYQSEDNDIHQNNLASTTSYAVECGDDQTAQVDASLNWWGAASGPAAGQISGDVLYCPWLDDVPGTGEPRSGVVTNADTTETFCSIQAAIDDADTDTGDTINVSAGTYVEDINVSKGVILQGLTAPTSATPVVIEGRITVNADNTTVQKLKITPSTPTGPVAAVRVSASSVTVAQNVITGMSGFVVGTIKGIWIYNADTTPITDINLTENAINGITNTGSGADGIMIQGVIERVNVHDNTIATINAGGWAYGIEITPTDVDPWTSPKDIDIQGNILSTINNVPYEEDPPHLPYPGAGVIIGAAGTPTTPHPANASETTVFNNSFSNVPVPVLNLDVAHVLDASGNYLGLDPAVLRQAILTQDPTNGPTLLNVLDYTPWLESGTDSNTTDAGFQGDFSTLWVTANDGQTGTTGRIQEGITLATGSAPTVNVLAGTYNEAITLNKTGLLVVSQGAITLSGASLTLTEGLWVLGAHNLNLASGVTVSSGSATAMVVADGAGALCRAYDSSGTFTFPIGDRTGDTEYSPATLNFTSGTFDSGQACVRVTDAAHPGYTTLPTAYITRYWTVTASGITGFAANAAFAYVDVDVEGTEGEMTARKVDGATWLAGPAVNADAHTFAMGVTGFSDFTAGSSNPTAVFLSSFTALPEGEGIRVAWETAAELDNLGFNLYRGESPAGPWVKLNAELIGAQNPGAVFGASYEWLDSEVTSGATVYYRLEDVDASGVSTFHGPVSATPAEPSAMHLVAFSAQGPVAGRVLALLVALGGLNLWCKRNW